MRRLSRQLAPALIGVIASVSVLWIATALRADACRDAGGRWDPVARACGAGPGGVAPELGARPWVVAALVGVVLLVVLWRTYTFVLLRAAARGRPPG